MSVTRSGPLTSGATSSPVLDILPVAHLGPPTSRPAPQRTPRRWRRSRRRCRERSRSTRSSCVRLPSPSRPRTISRNCPESTGPPAAAKTSADHSWTVRPAKSPVLSWTPTSALRRVTRVPGRSGFQPLPERARSRTRAPPPRGSPFMVALTGPSKRVTSSSPMSVSPPTRCGGAMVPPHRVGRFHRRGRTTVDCHPHRPRPRGERRPRWG